ncbi:MAG: hypothetical protein ACM3NO_08915, partial [Deltaproteobacteria bacterium]
SDRSQRRSRFGQRALRNQRKSFRRERSDGSSRLVEVRHWRRAQLKRNTSCERPAGSRELFACADGQAASAVALGARRERPHDDNLTGLEPVRFIRFTLRSAFIAAVGILASFTTANGASQQLAGS